MTAIAARTEDLPLAPTPAVAASPMLALMHDAIQKGLPIDVIRELKAMAKEMADDQSRRAFDAAMAGAKAEIPVIVKNKLVDFESKGENGRTTYRHEDLGEIARTVDPILARHGLSYRFQTTSDHGQPVVVTCIVAHRDGHNERNTLTAGRDDSGKKNSIQQIGSTITYLQRYTLKAALGLAAAADDDGKASEGPLRLSEEQVEELNRLIDQAVDARPNTDRAAWLETFLQYMKAPALNDIKAKDFGKGKAAIANAIKQAGK
ncbi:MAG: ERF family protein [Alphaproteobacteria bacterium]|nr:MAG: ERF family protein [Alphaproteobacteria bacterium]